MKHSKKSKQRIGLVLSETPGYSETFFRNKIKGLQSAGYQVTLFVQKKEASFDLCLVQEAPQVYSVNPFLQGINSLVVMFKMLFFLKRLVRFIIFERTANRSWIQLLKNIYNNSHILSTHVDWLHFGFATLALQSEHVAKVIGAKMAVSIRGFDIGIYPIKQPNCYSLLWEHVDKLHAISNDLLELAYHEGLKKTTAYQIITPAIDTRFFSADSITENHEVIRFISVARLHWKKGLVYTFEALAILKERGIIFEYILIGSGDEHERLVFAAHQLGVLDNIIFKGRLSHQEVQLELTKPAIYLQYSIQEGFCNAVLEAQSMGLLCIVSDAEGLQENVLHDQTGWVVPKRCPDLLAQKIMEVINLPNKNKKVVLNKAILRVKKDFNLENQQKLFIDFYTQ